MKALVKYSRGDGNMEIREVPEPTPGPGQVKVEVKVSGLCGSDLRIYHDNTPVPINTPVTIGHEFSGVVASVGEGVTQWKPGDRVVSETAYSICGKCHYCVNGNYHMCNGRKGLGYWQNGVFAKYTILPQERIHLLPDNIDFVSGALLEPLACVTRAVLEQTNITAGDIVLVLGPGVAGLGAMQIAKLQGAVTVVAGTSSSKEGLKIAKELGADYTIDVQEEELEKFISDITKGKGVDIVLECSGVAKAADDALKVIKKQGQYTLLELFGKPITLNFESVCNKELYLKGSMGSKWTSWEKIIDLVENNKIKTKQLVSHQFPLTEWKKAFEIFESREGLKVILLPVEEE
jgi:L-iditol 2-dehydrogenase